MKKIVVCFLCLVMASVVAQSVHTDFLIPKKKKEARLSCSGLKNEIGQSFGAILKEQSKVASSIALINIELVDRTQELLDNECSASAVQLDAYLKELKAFEQKIVDFGFQASGMLNSLKKGLPASKKELRAIEPGR